MSTISSMKKVISRHFGVSFVINFRKKTIVPIELETDDNNVHYANTILHHVLKFVDESITPQNYKIL